MFALRTAATTLHRSHQSAALLTRAARRAPASRDIPRPTLGGPTFPAPRPTPSTSSAPSTTVALIGFSSGTLGALCGVGGAVFAIPGLVRFAGLMQRQAAGCSLVAVTAIASTSAASFSRDAHVDWPVAAALGLGATAMTPLGAAMSRLVAPEMLRRGLGAFMLLMAPVMPLRGVLETRVAERPREEGKEPLLGGLGAVVGFGSGLLGISGGSLFTPLIALTAGLDSFRDVLGTSFAAMVVPTAVGAISYARMGCVNPVVVPPLLAGAVVGASVGSAAALAVPEDALRWAFAVLFSVLGVRIMRSSIKPSVRQVASATAARTSKVTTA